MNIPMFSLTASDGKTYSEKTFSSGDFILYVYPKDNTPGCTLESNDFEELRATFEDLGVKIMGLSADSIDSHKKFCTNQGLSFPLISDEEKTLIKALGAWGEKNMYGKKHEGIIRTTFFVQNGKIIKIWKNVRAKGHAQRVLHFLTENK